MTVTDSYAAGFLDGEGCIDISDRGSPPRPFLRVAMCNSNKDVISILHGAYGGHIQTTKHTNGWKDSYKVVLTSSEAESFLRKVKRLVRIKMPQVKLGLAFRRLKSLPLEKKCHKVPTPGGRVPWTIRPEVLLEESRIRGEIAALNRRGERYRPLRTLPKRPLSAPYIAGLVDGEGCINIYLQCNGTAVLRLTVTNCDCSIIDLVRDRIGGWTRTQRTDKGKLGWRASHTVTVTQARAEAVLRMIAPYAIVKARQIKVGLCLRAFQQLPWSDRCFSIAAPIKGAPFRHIWKRKPETIAREGELKRQMHELNRKGAAIALSMSGQAKKKAGPKKRKR